MDGNAVVAQVGQMPLSAAAHDSTLLDDGPAPSLQTGAVYHTG
jgi:hypothetical protein